MLGCSAAPDGVARSCNLQRTALPGYKHSSCPYRANDVSCVLCVQAEEALSAAAAKFRQVTTVADTLSTPAKASASADAPPASASPSGDTSRVLSGHSPAGGDTPAAMDDLKAAFSELRRQTAEAEQAKAAAADAGAACEWLGQQLAATEAQLQQLKDHLREQPSPDVQRGQRTVRGAAAMAGAINQWSRATHTELHHSITTSKSIPLSSATSADDVDETGTPVPSPVPVPAPLDMSGGFNVSPISRHRPETKRRRERGRAAEEAAIREVAVADKEAKGANAGETNNTEHMTTADKSESQLSLGLRGGTSVAEQFRARRRRGRAHQ